VGIGALQISCYHKNTELKPNVNITELVVPIEKCVGKYFLGKLQCKIVYIEVIHLRPFDNNCDEEIRKKQPGFF
jgi:hypothetical protein